jgi:hypothetical protein
VEAVIRDPGTLPHTLRSGMVHSVVGALVSSTCCSWLCLRVESDSANGWQPARHCLDIAPSLNTAVVHCFTDRLRPFQNRYRAARFLLLSTPWICVTSHTIDHRLQVVDRFNLLLETMAGPYRPYPPQAGQRPQGQPRRGGPGKLI